MWPQIGPITTYGTMYLVGILLHFILSRRIAKRYGMKRRVWLTVSICYMLGMVVGAKLLSDVRSGNLDLSAMLQARHWTDGGMWGGLLAYFALAVPAVLLLARQRLLALDLVALTIPIPWMAAKVGCFLNGCCYGRSCSLPWAVTFPEGACGAPAGVPVHPTQLYELGLMLAMLLLFTWLRSDKWHGTKLLWFFVLYGFGRAATDFLRGDTEGRLYLGMLSLTQLLCITAAAGALAAIALLARRSKRVMRSAG
ncbi:MAG: prolipoprotein diacylglyceryl transferase family protein [Phycisphaerales bacterium]